MESAPIQKALLHADVILASLVEDANMVTDVLQVLALHQVKEFLIVIKQALTIISCDEHVNNLGQFFPVTIDDSKNKEK